MARRGNAGRGRSGGRRATTPATRPASAGRGGPTIDEAVALMERGRLLDALRAAEALAAAAPRDPNVLQLLGMIAGRRHRFDDAVAHFQRLAELVPADPMARCRIGMSCMYAARFDEAEAAFARALELRPGFPAALRGRAELLERRGDAAAGLEALAPLLADPREAAEPATRLLHAQLLAAAGDHAAAAETAAAATAEPADMPPAFRRKLHFIRGRSLDRLGSERATDAAEAWARANATGAMPFDADAHDRETDAIIAMFSAERLAAGATAPRSRATSELPVLVVGMPRSGSTLAEQILAAHAAVGGAGETTAMPEVMAELARGHARPDAPRFPAWWDDVDEPSLTRAGLDYVRRLEAFRPSERTTRAAITRMVDKNLLNLSLVGATAEMLPAARFLICRRDPVDNGFSCWINDLSPVGFPWSGDLAAIGRVAGAADRLTDHWAQVLPERVRVLDYEAMVADPEGSSRELLAFAGLEWDDAVLRFHETGRAVTTLSYDQVRKPIYRSSVRRSDRYRPFLGPMIEAMRAAGLPVDPPAASDPG